MGRRAGRPEGRPRSEPREEEAARGWRSARARELVALLLCAFCLYGLLCLATFRAAELDGSIRVGAGHNLGGVFGQHLAGGLLYVLGFAAYAPFLATLAYAVALFLGRAVERPILKVLGVVLLAAMLSLLLAGFQDAGFTAMSPQGAGGAFGANLWPKVDRMFGGPGRLLLTSFGALVGFLLVTEWLFSHLLLRAARLSARAFRALARRPAGEEPAAAPGLPPAAAFPGGAAALPAASPRRRKNGRKAGAGGEADPDPPERASADEADGPDDLDAALDEPDVVLPEPPRDGEPDRQEAEEPGPHKVLLPARPRPARPKTRPKRVAQSELPFDEAYPFPPVDLFREAELEDAGATSDALQRGGESIVQKLASFGIQSEVVGASVGPAVIQYELRLAEGIRVNRIAGFEADLAAALRAVAVRVVAPIPGKDTIGIEVPNVERKKVFMRDLLDQFGRAEELAIPLMLGKDVAGNPIVEDLARMPHLLIAGTTGSGKSVCINAILLSILMTRTPAQVKLILVDPKMVELQAYRRVPHLCCDVVTNMKKAPAVLQWAVDEMENRYALLSAAGVNHIRNYNRLGQLELEKRLGRAAEPERVHLPYIVIVIDEFADLMNVAANEVEESIQRLAQKSRAVGMHVIVATQRPSSEVITGIIKANLPCQIAFKVNRRIDSRVILDSNGAEKLLGYGDMLYVPPGGGAMLRAQGSFVADEEMQAVVRFLEEHGMRPNFLPSLMQTQKSTRKGMAERDPLYREAAEVILGQQRGSATLLQRALSVGYTRATRLLEMMEEDGLVGPFVGSKSREVLLTLDEWKAREAALAAELEELEDGDAGEEDAGAGDAEAGPGDGRGARAGRAPGAGPSSDGAEAAMAEEGRPDDEPRAS